MKSEVKRVSTHIPLIFSSNDYFVPYMSVMLASVMTHASDEYFYEIILLHSGISEKNISNLKKQISTKKNFSFRLLNVSAQIQGCDFYTENKAFLTAETYYRLLAPFLLEEYDWAIYLDGDMVAMTDVAALAEVEVGQALVAAVRDFCGLTEVYDPELSRRSYMEQTLGIQRCDDYYIAGLLVMNLRAFRQEFSMEQMLELALSRKWECHDQDILNSLTQGRTKLLDARWNVLQDYGKHHLLPKELYQEWYFSLRNPHVIHYGGGMKPWRFPRVPRADCFWRYAKMSPFYEEIKTRQKQEWKENPRYRLKYCLQLLFPVGGRMRDGIKRITRPLWGRFKGALVDA